MFEEDLSSEFVSFVVSFLGTTIGMDEEGISVNGSFGIEVEEDAFELTPF